jgi:hypothetical protein
MVAIVTAIISVIIVTIFTAVELEKLKAKQQKVDIVAKLGLMASKEISNSQTELIRLTSEVIGSLEKYWSNTDTIQHVLLVCDVADQQVTVMESVMQAAMGGHVSVAAFTEMHYARLAMKISREAKDAALLGLLANGNVIFGGTKRIQHTGACATNRHEISAHDLGAPHPAHSATGRFVPEHRTGGVHAHRGHGRPRAVQGNDEGRVQHLPPLGGILPLRPRPRCYKGTKDRRNTTSMEGSSTVPVRPLCEAIRAGSSNMHDHHWREGRSDENGGPRRVRIIYGKPTQRNGHVQGREQPRGSGDESLYGKRPHKDHLTTRMHGRDEHAHLCSSRQRVQQVRQKLHYII